MNGRPKLQERICQMAGGGSGSGRRWTVPASDGSKRHGSKRHQEARPQRHDKEWKRVKIPKQTRGKRLNRSTLNHVDPPEKNPRSAEKGRQRLWARVSR